ncbi:hypothetical protein OF83DRAFT_1164967 [Amylostereum chailletii]|nr:hypothetical protein OF83DRAFT_1164967 [Amylostereum chailletii]
MPTNDTDSAPSAATPPTCTRPSSSTHLLTRGYTLPCSTAAQAFQQMVQPSSRFQLALDALLPILSSPRSELSHRILVAYILYSLYAPHPIAINPFKSALFDTFVRERAIAVQVSAADGTATSEREQLVWVLWKILKGDGDDIGPYSPSTLARSPLPPKLRPSNLTLEEENTRQDPDVFDSCVVPYRPVAPNLRSETTCLRVESPVEPRTQSLASGNITNRHGSSSEADAHTQTMSQGMTLLLAARERVLTLSEQRFLGPLLPQLTDRPMLTSVDLPPIIAHNPTLAHSLLVALLTRAPATAPAYLDVLAKLPPTLPSFDVLGRLFRDTTPLRDVAVGGNSTIADVVRMDVLGRFIHHAVSWLEEAEEQEREGLVSDDRFAKGVQNLCRFYGALLKLGIVDPAFDADSAEIAHFALRQARFEEANALYRALAMGTF